MDKVVTTRVYLDPEDVKNKHNLIKIGAKERGIIDQWIKAQKTLTMFHVKVFNVTKQIMKSTRYDFWIEKTPTEIEAEDLVNLLHHESTIRMPLASELLLSHIYGISQGYWKMNNSICKYCVACWENNT